MNAFNLPQSAKVPNSGRVPKTKIIANDPKKDKKSLNNIEKIQWLYKLSPTTLHIPKEGKIEEIEIFLLTLKNKAHPKEAIRTIKRAINLPILFKIEHENSFCYATYLIDKDNCFFSKWDEVLSFDFTATNLENLYESIIKKFLKEEVVTPHINLKESIDKSHKIEVLTKEIEALKKKIAREKQFKKRLELSRILKPKEEELKNIQKK